MTVTDIGFLAVAGLSTIRLAVTFCRCRSRHFDPAIGQYVDCFMIRWHKGTHSNRRIEWGP